MKKAIILAITIFVVSPALFAQIKAGKIDTTRYAALYSSPMHGSVSMKMPGNWPICGGTSTFKKGANEES